MAEFRAGALIKVAAPVSVPFEDHLHTSLLSDLAGIPVSSSVLVLDDDHPLRAAFDHPAPPTKIHMVNFPGPLRVKILWWATRALAVGTAISGAAVNWLDTHWTKVALLLSDGNRPPPQSMLERTHDEWAAAVRRVRVRAGAPLRKNSVDAHLNALIGRLCQALQIACLPLDWWEHDLWSPASTGGSRYAQWSHPGTGHAPGPGSASPGSDRRPSGTAVSLSRPAGSGGQPCSAKPSA